VIGASARVVSPLRRRSTWGHEQLFRAGTPTAEATFSWNSVKPIDEFWKEFDAKEMNFEVNTAGALLVYVTNCGPIKDRERILFNIAAVQNKHRYGDQLTLKAANARLDDIKARDDMPGFCWKSAATFALREIPTSIPMPTGGWYT
jgi:hypothetical protein